MDKRTQEHLQYLKTHFKEVSFSKPLCLAQYPVERTIITIDDKVRLTIQPSDTIYRITPIRDGQTDFFNNSHYFDESQKDEAIRMIEALL